MGSETVGVLGGWPIVSGCSPLSTPPTYLPYMSGSVCNSRACCVNRYLSWGGLETFRRNLSTFQTKAQETHRIPSAEFATMNPKEAKSSTILHPNRLKSGSVCFRTLDEMGNGMATVVHPFLKDGVRGTGLPNESRSAISPEILHPSW